MAENIVICRFNCKYNEVIPACSSGVCLHKEIISMESAEFKKFNKFKCPYKKVKGALEKEEEG